MTQSTTPSRPWVLASFATIYILWGSSYLFIGFAVETLPPISMVGLRFFIAGLILYSTAALNGAGRPTRRHWLGAFAVAMLMLVGGSALLAWTQQRVPSALAALLFATVPLWIVLLDWLRPQGPRPSIRVMSGIVLGFVGIIVLVGPNNLQSSGTVAPIDAGLLLLSALLWAAGSLYSRHAPQPKHAMQSAGMQMLSSSVMLFGIGLLLGEPSQFDPAAISTRSIVGLVGLMLIDAVTFNAYIWLLKVVPASRVATYAYINPVVALFLGWVFGGETITTRTLTAAALIVLAVFLITTYRRRPHA